MNSNEILLQEPAFHFDGGLPSSKSLMNRALVMQSFARDVTIEGQTDAEDVVCMQDGLKKLSTAIGTEPLTIHCGDAGTTFRFLALRASRRPGEYLLTGSERLLSRPQNELLPILAQLGVQAQFSSQGLKLRSQGWRLMVDGLQVNAERSSQFASAVLLSSWELPSPLHFSLSRKFVSEGYWQMTVQLVREWGMNVEMRGHEVFIPARAKVRNGTYVCEPDLSSAFSIAAAAAVGGEARIQNFPVRSLQPDRVFVRILKDMGVDVQIKDQTLEVRKTKFLNGVDEDLSSSPDLFPVLGVLCGLARTPSTLLGVGHLKYKESARLEKTQELLSSIGAHSRWDESSEALHIEPRALNAPKNELIFDPDRDHRMAMAAEVLRLAGFPITILNPSVVNKSFPQFFSLSRGDRA